MSEAIFEPLAGGPTMITTGGTRTAIRLSRPWQPPLPIAPETCPFCTKPQQEIDLPQIPTGWQLLNNLFTPHLRHRLVIPAKCWDADTLQTLGGATAIREALEVARLATRNDDVEMAAFIHVGQSAGQNLGHAHWHLMEVRVQQTPVFTYSPDALVHESERLAIVAMGARAGECIIITRGEQLPFNEGSIEELAATLEWIITRGNEKFRSTQGRSPEFIVSVRISAGGHFRYADYCPILLPWGATEYVFAPLEGGPITLAWPHQRTADHLRG